MVHKVLKIFFLFCTLGMLQTCGQKSEDEAGATAAATVVTDQVQGLINSQFGSQQDLATWKMVMIEKETGIARVADINSAGVYQFKKVHAHQTHTLALLSPDFVLSAFLSLPGTSTTNIKQYFSTSAKTLPRVIHRGQILTMPNTTDLTIDTAVSGAQAGDGIPDGAASILALSDLNTPAIDSDSDGLANYQDTDDDADGILDVFDPDDDGDGTLDVFDVDANGDSIADALQSNSELFFSEGLEYISVQQELSGTSASSTTTIYFTAKVRKGVVPAPIGVRVRAPSSVFESASAIAVDANGAESASEWDYVLLDDGNNLDGAADDLVYSRKVQLAANKAPRASQVFFVQLVFGSDADPYYWEYPYTFPNVTMSVITSTYDASNRRVTLSSSLFGGSTDFSWYVDVFRAADGVKVYISNPIAGATNTLDLPANIFESGVSYQYSVGAQVFERVPSYPPFIVKTPKQDLQ